MKFSHRIENLSFVNIFAANFSTSIVYKVKVKAN